MSDSGDKANTGESSTLEGSGSVDSPSNSDILRYLKWIDSKMTQMDNKRNKFDTLEQKFSSFDFELKKLLTFVHDQFNDNKEAV